MKYDPLGYYLSEISIRTSFLKGGDICATDDLKAIEKPIPAFGGWISISGKNCGIADASYEPFFNKLVENEKRDVEKWIREHLIEYFKAFQKAKEEVNEKKNSQLKTFKGRFYTHPFKAPNGFAEFRKDALQYLCETGARNRVYFEGKTLRVENIYKSSEFLIDSHMSTLQEAESLTIDKIIAVACFVVYTDSTRRTAERTVAIFTNASPILP
jgi:hypothetical protein